MEIVCAPWGIVSWEYPKQGLRDIAGEFGSTILDIGGLTGFHAHHVVGWRKRRGDKSYGHWITEHPGEVSSIIKPFVALYKEYDLSHPVAYANFLPHILGQKEDFDDYFPQMLALLQECVQAAGKSGVKFLIVRPLAVGIGSRDKWKANKEIYLKLARLARGYDLQILLEGQYRNHNGGLVRGLCADPHEALDWVDSLNEAAGFACFGFHLNTGQCSLLGQDVHEVVAVLGQRIKAVTLQDCDGLGDSALLPFTATAGGRCRTDWQSIIRGLREINFDGLLIMNFGSTAAVTSPLLKPALLKYARAVADFLAWQVGMENILKSYRQRVLFGAGNMCRAYMKCYGEKYPPLFTCDNDRNKWGQEFCGLEVKNPEALKELPEDCAVLICNIYYREIEAQLRQMGLKNPVGFFNDEYMPSFHFERIEDMEEENAAKDWGTDAERNRG